MVDRRDLIDAARRASAASDWSSALENLSVARAEGGLEVDDLATMARAAWWLGRVPESLALAEEAFRGLCDDDRMADAAMTALQLSLLWVTRGDLTIGTAWLNRARRILADVPEGAPHAYLVYLETSLGMVSTGDAWSDEDAERLAGSRAALPAPGGRRARDGGARLGGAAPWRLAQGVRPAGRGDAASARGSGRRRMGGRHHLHDHPHLP